jgi:hypothetical protein
MNPADMELIKAEATAMKTLSMEAGMKWRNRFVRLISANRVNPRPGMIHSTG